MLQGQAPTCARIGLRDITQACIFYLSILMLWREIKIEVFCPSCFMAGKFNLSEFHETCRDYKIMSLSQNFCPKKGHIQF